tara:strand:- start:262 stop:417 length:156 start_codon:yes stop_codon:yes gene_type:complete
VYPVHALQVLFVALVEHLLSLQVVRWLKLVPLALGNLLVGLQEQSVWEWKN